MVDFYKEKCTGDICSEFTRHLGEYDPMIGEALAACAEAVNRPLSFSPPGIPLEEELYSPVYTPGVQQEVDGHVITTGITEQVAEMILGERRNSIVDSIFVPCEQPILETPAVQKQQGKASGRAKAVKTAVGGLRRSTRQKAKVCSVPVAKRATHRLIKAFEVVGPNEPIGEEALEAFANKFGTPLTPEQIDAVRKLTSLDSGAVLAASAQLVAAKGADAMEDAGL
jgi:hypothetical protein